MLLAQWAEEDKLAEEDDEVYICYLDEDLKIYFELFRILIFESYFSITEEIPAVLKVEFLKEYNLPIAAGIQRLNEIIFGYRSTIATNTKSQQIED